MHRQRKVKVRAHGARSDEVFALTDRHGRSGIGASGDKQVAVRTDQIDGRHLWKVSADLAQLLVQLTLARANLGVVFGADQLDDARSHLLVQVQHLDGLLFRHAHEPVDHVIRIGDTALVIEIAVAGETGERKQNRNCQHDKKHPPRRREIARRHRKIDCDSLRTLHGHAPLKGHTSRRITRTYRAPGGRALIPLAGIYRTFPPCT